MNLRYATCTLAILAAMTIPTTLAASVDASKSDPSPQTEEREAHEEEITVRASEKQPASRWDSREKLPKRAARFGYGMLRVLKEGAEQRLPVEKAPAR